MTLSLLSSTSHLTLSLEEWKGGLDLASISYDGRELTTKTLKWLRKTLSKNPAIVLLVEPHVTRSSMESLAQKLKCPDYLWLKTGDTHQIPEGWRGQVSHLILEHPVMVVCARLANLSRLIILRSELLHCTHCPKLKCLKAIQTAKVKITACEALNHMKLNCAESLEWKEGKEFVKFTIPIGCFWNGKKIVDIIEQDNGSHCLVHEN